MRNSYTNSYRDSYTVGIKPAHPERHPDPGTVPHRRTGRGRKGHLTFLRACAKDTPAQRTWRSVIHRGVRARTLVGVNVRVSVYAIAYSSGARARA